MSLIENLIETQEFATLPPVASKVLQMLDEDDVEIREISKVIEADASLTLKLLRVANSPLYATRNEVSSIHQAIITLGLNRLTNIVLGVSIFSKFLMSSQKVNIELMEKFWWHSSCTGMVAKSLAVKINRFFKENEFIGGLLHDIGKLAMLQFDSDKYTQVVEKVKNGAMDIEAENDLFGVTHIDVGTEIAKLWKLPNELQTIIQYHTNPSEAPDYNELVASVRFSDILAEVWGADFYEGFQQVVLEQSDAWQVLSSKVTQLQELDVEVFTFELEKDFQNSSDFLNLIVQDI